MTDVFAGQYHSVFKGRGMEFAEVRHYQPGDDVRTIDWNVTARTGVPYVKRFAEERELTVMLLVDASASTRFGSVRQLKSALAAELGALLAFSAITNNDKVGLVMFTDRIELALPPRKGTRHVLRVIREVLTRQPAGRGTDLAAALEHLATVTKRRCGRVRALRLPRRRLPSVRSASPRAATTSSRSCSTTRASASCRTSGWSSSRRPRRASATSSTPATRGAGGVRRERHGRARRARPLAARRRRRRDRDLDRPPLHRGAAALLSHAGAPTVRPGLRLGAALVVASLLAAVAARAQSPSPAASASPAPAPVAVQGSVEKGEITIGQRFRYTVEVAAPKEIEILLAQPTERLGDFEIVDFGDLPAAERDGTIVITRWFQLVGYSTGEFLVDSPPVRYRLPGEDLAEAPHDETLVSIASLLAKEPDATDIRDIKPPEEPPIDRRPYYMVAAAVGALLLLGFLAYRFFRRTTRLAAAPPPRPAHEIAHEELARLRARGLPEQGAFKEYYSALTAIIRSYLEQRFRLRAPEMTTEEFLMVTARGAAALQSGHRALLGDFLGESDLVKFARHLPTLADAERAFGAAARFVDETALAEARTKAAPRAGGGTATPPPRAASDATEGSHAPG